jgi:STELLO glycosyltransferases
MNKNTAIVITSIAKSDNKVLQTFALESSKRELQFIVIGDKPSPADFHIEGCNFYGLKEQRELDFSFAQLVPERHYSRKNIGYLIAIKNGAKLIVETDDDNFPREQFWNDRQKTHQVPLLRDTDWVNVYKYFSDGFIWPRGYPLEHIQKNVPELNTLEIASLDCPIQQGLADENPDIDAVFRLTQALPHNFNKNIKLALGQNSWCPFNSQNTSFYADAFPLLYLPSFCSFRMTDIWRSFVAQRICWENGWHLLFEEATVWQERNTHNLLRDFEEEIPGYLNNAKIAQTLSNLKLKKGKENCFENLISCYQALIEINVVGKEEIPLLQAWINDLSKIM